MTNSTRTSSRRQINVSVSEEQYQQLIAFAERQGVTNLTAAVRMLVTAGLGDRTDIAWTKAVREQVLFEVYGKLKGTIASVFEDAEK